MRLGWVARAPFVKTSTISFAHCTKIRAEVSLKGGQLEETGGELAKCPLGLIHLIPEL